MSVKKHLNLSDDESQYVCGMLASKIENLEKHSKRLKSKPTQDRTKIREIRFKIESLKKLMSYIEEVR